MAQEMQQPSQQSPAQQQVQMQPQRRAPPPRRRKPVNQYDSADEVGSGHDTNHP